MSGDDGAAFDKVWESLSDFMLQWWAVVVPYMTPMSVLGIAMVASWWWCRPWRHGGG